MKAYEFFYIFLVTIVIVRVFLFLKPVPSPTIGKFRMHHYMYGLLAVALGLLIGSLVIYAIGLGLFVDELAYLLIRGKTHTDNYSWASLFGTSLFVVIVFVFKEYLVMLLS